MKKNSTMKNTLVGNEITEEQRKNFDEEILDIVYNFSKKMLKEFGEMIKVIALFGSQARKDNLDPNSDIDVLIIVDDATYNIDENIAKSYRVITAKIIEKISKKLHITTVKLTHFWEYVKSGDPVILNMLRDGYAIIDSGIFTPLQILLKKGRIRPSEEAIYTYYERSLRNIKQVEMNLLKSVSDLYWATIDSAHAALMRIGELPASPREIPTTLKERLVKENLISEETANFAREIYDLSKKIAHDEITTIKGCEIDELKEKTEKFINEMKKIILK